MAALRRDALADGVAGFEEAGALVTLDRKVDFAHPSWTATLIAALTDFAVWAVRPTGIIDPAKGAWLADNLLGQDASPRARRVLVQIVLKADRVDEGLLARIAESDAAGAKIRLAA